MVLQAKGTNVCPLCREAVVLQTDSSMSPPSSSSLHMLIACPASIDTSRLNLMKFFFPVEASERQRANEAAAARDRFGRDSGACEIM